MLASTANSTLHTGLSESSDLGIGASSASFHDTPPTDHSARDPSTLENAVQTMAENGTVELENETQISRKGPGPPDSEISDSEISDSDSSNDLLDGYEYSYGPIDRKHRFLNKQDIAERTKRAKVYVKRSAQYTKLIEDRLQLLEGWVQELRNEPSSKTAAGKSSKRYKWFDPTDSDPIGPDDGFTLEDLLEYYKCPHDVCNLEIRRFSHSKWEKKSRDACIDVFTGPCNIQDHQLAAHSTNTSTNVARIVVCPVIRITLMEITDIDTSVTMIAPFKLIMLNRDVIRKYTKELQDFLEESRITLPTPKLTTTAIPDVPSRPPSLAGKENQLQGSANPNDATVGPENMRTTATKDEFEDAGTDAKYEEDEAEENDAKIKKFELLKKQAKAMIVLPRLQLLVDFMDTDLKQMFEVRANLRAGEVDEAEFENLWHCFEPGDIVLARRSGSSRAYRVLQVTGGRRFLDSRTERERQEKDDTPTPMVDIAMSTEKYSALRLDCYYIDFDGKSFGPVQENFSIESFTGRRPIMALPVYPLRFYKEKLSEDISSVSKDHEKLMEFLVKRGDDFCSLNDKQSICHMRYSGRSLGDRPEEINGPVVIDCLEASMSRIGREDVDSDEEVWTPKLGIESFTQPDEREWTDLDFALTLMSRMDAKYPAKHSDFDVELRRTKAFLAEHMANMPNPTFTRSRDEISREDLATCPQRLFGFVLRSRKWASLNVELVREYDEDQDALDKLVLPEGHKELVEALVKTHLERNTGDATSATPEHGDVIPGKGKGVILLLHGAPGVGKTSTAEAIAELTRRPLFPITCGDIGDHPYLVQRNLENNFHLAHRWNCVLLLDEADVFLAQRTRDDLTRNAIVSVFLRVLEYYGGILFLTTNRVGDFDEAFKSRIHLSLYYPPLDLKQTIKIWRMNLETARQNGVNFDEDEIIRFAKKHFNSFKDAKDRGETSTAHGRWNGRQIRNAFQTATALAFWEAKKLALAKDTANANDGSPVKAAPPKVTLARKHLESVADASWKFDDYLRDIYGADIARQAEEVGARGDTAWLRKKSQKAPWKKSKKAKSLSSSSIEESSESESESQSASEEKKRKKERDEKTEKKEKKGKGKSTKTTKKKEQKKKKKKIVDENEDEDESGSSNEK